MSYLTAWDTVSILIDTVSLFLGGVISLCKGYNQRILTFTHKITKHTVDVLLRSLNQSISQMFVLIRDVTELLSSNKLMTFYEITVNLKYRARYYSISIYLNLNRTLYFLVKIEFYNQQGIGRNLIIEIRPNFSRYAYWNRNSTFFCSSMSIWVVYIKQ